MFMISFGDFIEHTIEVLVSAKAQTWKHQVY